MAVTTENIALGSCDVTFKGTDLGATKGGVEVEISTEKYTVTVDQTGETPLKDIITGTMVKVTVPLAETKLTTLNAMLPQSVLQTASGSIPTGYLVNNGAGYAVGVTTIAIDAGTNVPAAGDTFTFAGHAAVYRTVSSTGTSLTFVNAGTGGLVAPVADDEALTFTAKAAGVEIRTGVNIDLLAISGELKLHPTGIDSGITGQDFVAFKAAPSANFSFAYQLDGERVYEVEFTCYPDTASNNRIAVFGAPAA